MLLLSSLGCAPAPVEPDYAGVRLRCADEIEAIHATTSAVDVATAITPACAETLGESVGLSWASFDFNYEHLGRSDTGAYLLTGLLTLAADDTRDAESVLSDPDLPELARSHLTEIADALPSDAPASQLWYGWLRAAIAETTLLPLDELEESFVADYDVENLRVRVTPLVLAESLFGDLTLADAPLPAHAAGVLVHEATHLYVGHEGCNDEASCDATPEGAYGVQVWWLRDWMRGHPSMLEDPACVDLDEEVTGICWKRIDADAGWAPCDFTCD